MGAAGNELVERVAGNANPNRGRPRRQQDPGDCGADVDEARQMPTAGMEIRYDDGVEREEVAEPGAKDASPGRLTRHHTTGWAWCNDWCWPWWFALGSHTPPTSRHREHSMRLP